MSASRPTKTYSKRDIDTMLDVLQVFETDEAPEPEFQDWEPMPEHDGKVLHVPYWTYPPDIDQYFDLAYSSSCYIDPYKRLPEDPKYVREDGMDTFKVIRTPRQAKRATINQVRRYLVLCIRGEKFCSGYIANQLSNGTFIAVVRRLRELREQMG